ncbi:hypothetical protein [Sphingomonas sp. PAMC 26621]|uniref:hypothetical protein n=1 Tax=Sphingomonas sp. PAMC 26621 TaxID=1112213 RepID=UPI00028896E2|nr:hypothetical protein [Sphingomonas sp. PAMC 26621]
MTDLSTMDFAAAAAVIRRLAEVSEALAQAAGVSGTQTAGSFVSYLAEHPEDIEPLLRFGASELPEDWIHYGRLTWMGAGGKLHHPAIVRLIVGAPATPVYHRLASRAAVLNNGEG